MGKADRAVAVQVGSQTAPVFLLRPSEAMALGRALIAESQDMLAREKTGRSSPVSRHTTDEAKAFGPVDHERLSQSLAE